MWLVVVCVWMCGGVWVYDGGVWVVWCVGGLVCGGGDGGYVWLVVVCGWSGV